VRVIDVTYKVRNGNVLGKCVYAGVEFLGGCFGGGEVKDSILVKSSNYNLTWPICTQQQQQQIRSHTHTSVPTYTPRPAITPPQNLSLNFGQTGYVKLGGGGGKNTRVRDDEPTHITTSPAQTINGNCFERQHHLHDARTPPKYNIIHLRLLYAYIMYHDARKIGENGVG